MFGYKYDSISDAEYLAEKYAGETIGLDEEYDPEYEFYREHGFWEGAEAEGSGEDYPEDDDFGPDGFDEIAAEREMALGPDEGCPF